MATTPMHVHQDATLCPAAQLLTFVSPHVQKYVTTTADQKDFERDPVVDACSQTCQNPPAYANLKCAYWGNPLVAASARVEGQWRNKFHAVIAGSNAYVNSTVLLDTAYINAFLGEAAIEAPIDCKGTDTFMGYKLFDNVPFDVRLCAAACTAKTIYNRSQGSKRSCNFWNTYMLLKDGVAQGQFCAM